MKRRAFCLSLAVVASVVAGSVACAGGEKLSVQQPLERSVRALSDFARASVTLLRAEIGTGKAGTKHALVKEVDEGEYVAFGVGAKANIAALELSAIGEDGKEIKKAAGADEVYIASIPVEKKQKLKLELSVDTANQGDQVGIFVLCLLTKKQPPEPTDFIIDAALEQVKTIEGEGYQVEFGQFDTLPKDGWTLSRKLAAGNYRVIGVSDDQRVKDLDVQVKDGSGTVVGKDDRKDHISLAKADGVKAGDHTVAVTATWAEGEKSSFAGVVIAHKP